MVLPFSTAMLGKPNFFIEKIWNGIIEQRYAPISECFRFQKKHLLKFGQLWDHDEDKNLFSAQHPKIHSIRMDVGDLWKPGMKIHFVINNRQKTRFQFAPVLQVVSTQKIEIHSEEFNGTRWNFVMVDERMLTFCEIEKLAKFDGFESQLDFFKYFTQNFKEKKSCFRGKLIHWTNAKY